MKWILLIAVIAAITFGLLYFNERSKPESDDMFYQTQIGEQARIILETQGIIDSLKEQSSVEHKRNLLLEDSIAKTRKIYVSQKKPSYRNLPIDSAVSLLAKSLRDYAAEKDSL